MSSYRLHKVAKNQVLKIWKNTYDKWGIEQADKSIDELYAKLDNLDKQLIREAPQNILPGLKFFHYTRHSVFFREKEGIEILLILHDHMDIPARLKEHLNNIH